VAGDILVYPDHKDRDGDTRQGHVALIVNPLTRTIVDCSSTYGCSVRDGRSMFLRPGVVVCRYEP
jgi:hypothetical protein